jgi:hypothetical protein
MYDLYGAFSDAPEIENEEAYIHTSEGDKTEVICIVHSSPKAEVTWYKDGQPLEPTPAHTVEHRGNRHTLTISGIEPAHFGTYSCKAQNQYGEDKKSTVVTGQAPRDNYICILALYSLKNCCQCLYLSFSTHRECILSHFIHNSTAMFP